MTGLYTWTPYGAGKYWITSPSGEGGAFPAEEVEPILHAGRLCGDLQQRIAKYFWENF